MITLPGHYGAMVAIAHLSRGLSATSHSSVNS